MRIRTFQFAFFVVVAFSVYHRSDAQSIFNPQETTRQRFTPDTSDLDEKADFEKKYDLETKKRIELQKQLNEIKAKYGSNVAPSGNDLEIANISPTTAAPSSSLSKNADTTTVGNNGEQPSVGSTKNQQSVGFSVVQRPLVFGISTKTKEKYDFVKRATVPSGSYVKVKILTGVEASSNEQTPYPMLLQADYAFTGPNRTKINLSNCFFIAKTNGNLSTERVIGKVETISCVKDDGQREERSTNGFLAGEDSTFGIVGKLISKQGQVLAAAIIASLAKGAGDALAAAQTSTSVVAGNAGAPASATNVTGSTPLYVGGKAVTDAATLVANWYLQYAQQLVPAIAVGSGRSVWVVMQSSVDIPALNDSTED